MNNKNNKSMFDLIAGLKPLNPNVLAEFERAMEDVIPQIVEDVEERRLLAAESRDLHLKC